MLKKLKKAIKKEETKSEMKFEKIKDFDNIEEGASAFVFKGKYNI